MADLRRDFRIAPVSTNLAMQQHGELSNGESAIHRLSFHTVCGILVA